MLPFETIAQLKDNIIVFVLFFFRIFAMMYLSPFFGNRSIPETVRMGIALIFTILIFQVVPHPVGISEGIGVFSLTFLIMKEVLLGLVIGYAGKVVLTIMRYSGDTIGRLMGLREGSMFDPMFQEKISQMAQFQFILFMLIFLSLDGHYFLIKLIVKSFEIVPLGAACVNGQLIKKFVSMISKIFELGIKYSAPIMAFLLITTVAFGILGKAIPEMNLMILMLPIKIAIGLLGLVVVFPFLIGFIYYIIQIFYKDLETVLRLV
ncbi:flagellar biosynthetic protein FliR [bacterium]|nr:flagellar biosynthetic protein FliR [bacterium]